MKCANCAYYWKEDWEDYAQCHWEARCPGDMAPCDEEDYDENEYYDDYEECGE